MGAPVLQYGHTYGIAIQEQHTYTTAVAGCQVCNVDTRSISYFDYTPINPTSIGLPANAIINIDVKASVGGTCGFATNGAPNASFTGLPIEAGWTRQVPFTAECTAPWRIAVSSLNGALKNASTVPVGYTNKAAYDVALNVASDGGTVTGTCPVAQIDQALGSSPCNFKGTASTTNGLQVLRSFGLAGSFIQMTAPAYSGSDVLYSGSYSDTLTVTVSPAV